LSVSGDRAGFWFYPCVVASTSADSRVLHVRVSLHFAEIYSGPLSRRLVLSRVRHNVLFLCLCDKRCHWSRENSYQSRSSVCRSDRGRSFGIDKLRRDLFSRQSFESGRLAELAIVPDLQRRRR